MVLLLRGSMVRLRPRSQYTENEMGIEDKGSLFGDSGNKSGHLRHTLGSELHEWSDLLLDKLINIRFNGDYRPLIRQLSQDLTEKEQEIILLREYHLQRERLLYKICASHGNLTHLEVDKLLSTIRQDNSVDHVLENMINNALQDPLAPSDNLLQGHGKAKVEEPTIESAGGKKSWLRGWIQSPDGLRYRWSRSTSSLPLENSSAAGITEESPSQLALELVRLDQTAEATQLDEELFAGADSYGFVAPNSVLEITKRNPEEKISLDTRSGTSQYSKKASDSSYATLQEIGRRHDDEKQAIENRWNFFCNEVRKLREQAERKKGKEDPVVNFGLRGLELKSLDKGLSFTEEPYLKQFRRLVAKLGVPGASRSDIWFELSGASNIRVPGEYDRLVQLAEQHASDTSVVQSFNQIDLDLHRTMPTNVYFHNNSTSSPGPLHYRLKRILEAFVILRSDIGYVQGMNKIVGNLLIADKKFTEEDTFWLFVALNDEVLPSFHGQNYFSPTSLKHIRNVQGEIAHVHFASFMPKLYAHLKHLQVQIEFITMNWWLLVFTDIFNLIDLWYRMLDNLLVCDHSEDFLKALSLGIFKHYEKKLLSLDNYDDVYLLMNRDYTRSFGLTDLMERTKEFERKITKAQKHT